MAKNGSDFFYYAMAFAAPGSAIEFLNQPVSAPKEDLSTDLIIEESDVLILEEPKEETAFTEEPSVEIPENRRGKITEMQYSAKEGGSYIAYKNAIIKNCTTHSTNKIKSMLKESHELSLSSEIGALPQILIYHTHATEGFEAQDSGVFDTEGTWRSTDNSKNMVAVGDVLESVLNRGGIGVIHDRTQHDDPSYNGSYQRSAVTISGYLNENPTIEICLDLHRDAIEPSEKEIIKPTAVINGKKAAQIMIIAGCDDGSMNMPEYWENLRFAAALADKLEELYPGITRPILFDYRKYNMDLSPGLVLIEIGATGNTLDEAKYSAELLGNALIALFFE
ncbi:MAG: stage II sporulation protein P [Oscillospiraceae bacterium]|nr:stage II sporulation protein P [Oscillospiraceae bacterium]